jgi:hypothetical protein
MGGTAVNEAQVIAFPRERAAPTTRLVPLRELQELFAGSERWWRYRIAEGMPTHRYCAQLRFDPAEVERWLKENRHGL